MKKKDGNSAGGSAPTWAQDDGATSTLGSGSLGLGATGDGLDSLADAPTAPGTGQEELASEWPDRYSDPVGGPILLGRGGMGDVHLVQDHHLGREVARKEIRRGAVSSLHDRTARRFLHEARLTARLEHPGIVPVYELGLTDDDLPYYTMRRIHGQTLSARLDDAASAADRLRLVEPFREACNAMAYAHAHGVVHRDLKPDNIMIGRFGDTVVLDWGIARAGGEDEPSVTVNGVDLSDLGDGRTRDGAVVGTPQYMSPEQSAGELSRIGPPSDVWSLGAILYEILTGARLIEVGRAELALQRVLSLDAEALAWPDDREIPRELKGIVRRALQQEPDHRYRDASAMADDLQAWWDGALVSAVDYRFRDHLHRFARRHIAVLASGLLSVVVITSLVIGGALRLDQERDLAVAARDEATVQLLEARAREAEVRDAQDLAIAYAAAARSLQDTDARRAWVNRLVAAAPQRGGFQTDAGVFSQLANLTWAEKSLLLVSSATALLAYDAKSGAQVGTLELPPELAGGGGVRAQTSADGAWFVLFDPPDQTGPAIATLCVLDPLLTSRDCVTLPGGRALDLSVSTDGRTALVSEGKGRPASVVLRRGEEGWQQHRVDRSLALSPDGGVWSIVDEEPREVAFDDLPRLSQDYGTSMMAAGIGGGTMAWTGRSGPLFVRFEGDPTIHEERPLRYNQVKLEVLSASRTIVGHGRPRTTWIASEAGRPVQQELEGGVMCTGDGTEDIPTTMVTTPGRRSPLATISRLAGRRVPQRTQRALDRALESCTVDVNSGRIAMLAADGWVEWIDPVRTPTVTQDVNTNRFPTTSFVALSTDGHSLAVAGSSAAQLLDTETLQPAWADPHPGQLLALGPMSDGRPDWAVWEPPDRDYVDPLRHGGLPRSDASSLLVRVGQAADLQTIDLPAGAALTDRGQVRCVPHPDGCCELRAYGSSEPQRLCEGSLTGEGLPSLDLERATSVGGQIILRMRDTDAGPEAMAHGRLFIFAEEDNRLLSTVDIVGRTSTGSSPNQRWLGVMDGRQAQVIDLLTGTLHWRAPLSDFKASGAQLVVVADNGSAVAASDLTSAVFFANATSQWSEIPAQPAESVALSADGSRLAVVRNDGLSVHDTRTAAVLLELPAEATVPNSAWAWFIGDDSLLTVSRRGPFVRRIPLALNLWADTAEVLGRTAFRICPGSFDPVRLEDPGMTSVWADVGDCGG